MDTILVFSTSIGRANADMLAGVREFAKDAEWNVQSFLYDGEPFPVRKLLDFWTPAGCIVESCGNGVSAGIIDQKAFRRTPVVYMGSEPTMTPKDAACVVHDAESVANAAARELMTIGMESFAFVGAKGKGWSGRRKVAFAEAMKLNARPVSAIDVHPTSAGVYDKDATRLRKWLLELPKPCGVMAADDEIAATAISICRLSGIDVPNDIAIVGVDDNESLCENTVPTLSSVRPDFQQGGRFAARILARMIHGGRSAHRETVFGVSGITRRGSTRVFKRRDAEVSAALERIAFPEGRARRIFLLAPQRGNTFPTGHWKVCSGGDCRRAHVAGENTPRGHDPFHPGNRRAVRIPLLDELPGRFPRRYRSQSSCLEKEQRQERMTSPPTIVIRGASESSTRTRSAICPAAISPRFAMPSERSWL